MKFSKPFSALGTTWKRTISSIRVSTTSSIRSASWIVVCIIGIESKNESFGCRRSSNDSWETRNWTKIAHLVLSKQCLVLRFVCTRLLLFNLIQFNLLEEMLVLLVILGSPELHNESIRTSRIDPLDVLSVLNDWIKLSLLEWRSLILLSRQTANDDEWNIIFLWATHLTVTDAVPRAKVY